MSTAVTIEVMLPEDLDRFRLPAALDERLQELLDKQDHGGGLTLAAANEAAALADIAETLTSLQHRVKLARTRLM